MHLSKLLLILGALFSACTLSAEVGWTDLFEGGRTDAWRSARGDAFPKKGWVVESGVLSLHAAGGEESRGAGDILTRARYADFELEFEFKLSPGANSGVKIFVQPELEAIDRVTGKRTSVGSSIGMEFQLLDDALHPDAKAGRNGNRTIGSFYDVMAARSDKVVKPIGEWNTGRIIVKGAHVEYWLNGAKTVEFERGSPAFREAVAQSKFRDIPGFGEWPSGHILLQDHGDAVSFRNVRIRGQAID